MYFKGPLKRLTDLAKAFTVENSSGNLPFRIQASQSNETRFGFSSITSEEVNVVQILYELKT